MNGRKARAHRKALARSRRNQGSNLASRGEKIIADEGEQAARAELADARKELELLLASANESFRKGVKVLEEARAEARGHAYAGYDERRAKILKKQADKQAVA